MVAGEVQLDLGPDHPPPTSQGNSRDPEKTLQNPTTFPIPFPTPRSTNRKNLSEFVKPAYGKVLLGFFLEK